MTKHPHGEKWNALAPLERFSLFVEKTKSCWIWRGCRTIRGGYGKIVYKGKEYRAHRFSYELHVGKIPRGIVVCHKCDNPPCVNPDHLFLGTTLDNTRDMYAKKRDNAPKGEAHQWAKFTKEDVDRIRSLHLSGKSVNEIKELLGAGYGAVYNIVTGRSWKNSFSHQ